MIDLHQGLTGEELRDAKPGLGAVAIAELEALSALLRGQLRRAAQSHLGAAILLGRTATQGLGKLVQGLVARVRPPA